MKSIGVIFYVVFYSVPAYLLPTEPNLDMSRKTEVSSERYNNIPHYNRFAPEPPSVSTLHVPQIETVPYKYENSNDENFKTQYLTNRYDYRTEPVNRQPFQMPRIPIENSAPIRQTVPTTYPQKAPGINNLNPSASALQYIASNPYIKALYTSTVPLKQYTIIHANGTVEHANDLGDVALRHPNYVMVNAEDILRPLTGIPKPTLEHNYGAVSNKQNAWTENNYNQGTFSNQHPTQYSNKQVVTSHPEVNHQNFPLVPTSDQSFGNQASVIKQQNIVLPNNQLATTSKNANQGPTTNTPIFSNAYTASASSSSSSSTPEAISIMLQKLFPQSLDTVVTSNTSYEGEITKRPTKDTHLHAVASNPVAIYPDTKKIQHTITPEVTFKLSGVIEEPVITKIQQTAVDSSINNQGTYNNPSTTEHLNKATAPSSNVQTETINQEENQTSPIITQTHNYTSFNVQPIILPSQGDLQPTIITGFRQDESPPTNVSRNSENIFHEAQGPTLISGFQIDPTPFGQSSANKTSAQTKPIAVDSNSGTGLYETSATNNSTNFIKTNQTTNVNQNINVNTFENITAVNATINEIDAKNNISNEEPSLNSTSDPWTNIVFTEEDRALIEAHNDNHNVYFHILPSDSKSDSDRKIITYPNGTTVEDFIETLMEDSQGKLNATSPSSSNSEPWTSFEFSEESLLETMRNNDNHNVYFLFLPPKPRVATETRRTIYPNGTIVEDIIQKQL